VTPNANRLFAEAYGKDADFFAFYRSMTAYENGLKAGDTRFLLRPDSDFFRYFSNPSGKDGDRDTGEARKARPRAALLPPFVQTKNSINGSSNPMRSIAFADFLIGLGILFRARRLDVRGKSRPGCARP